MDLYLIIKVALAAFGFVVLTSEACNAPTSFATGSYWVPSVNCSGTYDTPTHHCHCWGKCGFICDKTSSGSTSGTTRTTISPTDQTCHTGNENGPNPLPSGGTWVPDPGCPLGQRPGVVVTIPDSGTRCRCWRFCGYICQPPPAL